MPNVATDPNQVLTWPEDDSPPVFNSPATPTPQFTGPSMQRPSVTGNVSRGGSSGGGGIADGFAAFASIATALTPLVSMARPKTRTTAPVRRQPAQHTASPMPAATGGNTTPWLLVGGIGLAVLVLGVVALKK